MYRTYPMNTNPKTQENLKIIDETFFHATEIQSTMLQNILRIYGWRYNSNNLFLLKYRHQF